MNDWTSKYANAADPWGRTPAELFDAGFSAAEAWLLLRWHETDPERPHRGYEVWSAAYGELTATDLAGPAPLGAGNGRRTWLMHPAPHWAEAALAAAGNPAAA